jgi:hypothetical protein
MSRVVIAGSGALGQSLAARLKDSHDVHFAAGDLTAPHVTEVAFAGAHTVVMLARANAPIAKLPKAEPADLDLLLADSVARAVKLAGVKRLVHFACGDDDVRVPLLERAGVPLAVLRGGGPDPVEHLATLVNGGTSLQTAAWTGPAREEKPPRFGTCSIQRYPRPANWSALELARAYFEWLPSDTKLAKTSEREGAFTISMAGVRSLVLRHVPGRSSDDLAWLEVADGAMARRSLSPGRFEFRMLLDGSTAMTSLIGYEPSLPFAVYRITQALLHERVMRRFATWLEAQK